MRNKYKVYVLILLLAVIMVLLRHPNVVSASTSGITSDGTLTVDGQPFFPFGFYEVAWSPIPWNTNNYTVESDVETFTRVTNIKGVRLKIREANMAQDYFGIVEIEVNDGAGPNQATTATASATSLNSDPNHSPAELNDGRLTNDYASAYHPNLPEYVTLTWGSGKSFDKVTLKAWLCYTIAPSYYDVEVSVDGLTGWTKVASSDKMPAGKLSMDMNQLAADGFNFMHASADTGNGFNSSFVDDAGVKGIKLMPENINTIVKYDFLTQWKDKSGLLGWSICDDCDPYNNPSTVQSYKDAVRAIDPNHITYGAGVHYTYEPGYNVGSYVNILDAMGREMYPIGSSIPMNTVYAATKDTVDAYRVVGKPVFGIIQTFSWHSISPVGNPDPVLGRAPDPSELRNMTYQSLAAGAKGIIFFPYYFSPTHTMIPSDLYTETKAMVPEINALKPALMLGQRTEVATGNPDLRVTYWEYGGKVYVIAVNTSYDSVVNIPYYQPGGPGTTSAINASIPLPAGYQNAVVKSMFTRLPSTLSIGVNGKLSGTVGAEQVQVYELTPVGTSISLVTGKTLGSLQNGFTGEAGFNFTTANAARTVASLGRFFVSGNNGSHTVSLYKESDKSLVASCTVNMAMGTADEWGFKYCTLPAPVTLMANTAYDLVASETSGGDQYYHDDTTVTLGTGTPNFAIFKWNGSWYYDSTTSHSFGPVNLLYKDSSMLTGKTLGSVLNGFTGEVGFNFTTASAARTVTSLGRFFVNGNSGSHTLSLYKESDKSIVASCTVNMATGTADGLGFKYCTLSTPVPLLANTVYDLVASETSGGDQYYHDDTTVTLGTGTPNFAIFKWNGSWYYDSTTSHSFGPVNLLYY
ncbi:hypothetical protein Back11_01970 [Paenibacillus baekrokdamisoli]|uniref:F5/8 type C domain-containing protein n=2 Tax=Paenibacillus baekrokdamisoli TaxID=1712516 RepID=A0A3G9IL02_9BACL|nr:DUF4082 domain-containing protein [Paenibacillus baekrokdamisoli]BBH18852.1 hypothetical protein Back11_01970 [Paenibacillus baekrokdamisoli]